MAAANAAGEAARAATRQAKVAEDTLVKRERPYIFIYNVSALLEDTEKNEFYVSYSVSNFGNIPAIIEGAWIGFEFSNAGAPPSPPLLNEDNSLLASPILAAGDRRDNWTRLQSKEDYLLTFRRNLMF